MDSEQQRTRRMEPSLFERITEATRKLRSTIGSAARLETYRPAQRWSQALRTTAATGQKVPEWQVIR